jgi:hypothetical protein
MRNVDVKTPGIVHTICNIRQSSLHPLSIQVTQKRPPSLCMIAEVSEGDPEVIFVGPLISFV